ncbi:MAG: flavin reductase family protein [Bowdeniella nasicola]|nr:flavin reductase family protein [Bowdeniella nasicola]
MNTSQEPLREGFRRIFRRHVAGVTVVTYDEGGAPGGFTATSVISVAAAPPAIAFAVSAGSAAGQALRSVDSVCVNFLDDERSDIATRFAARGADRFAEGGYRLLPGGEPVLVAASAWLRAEVIDRVPVSESMLIIARVAQVSAAEHPVAQPSPLVYLNRTYRKLAELDERE